MRNQRGMVTAELAVATLAAGALLIMLSWGVFLITVQLRCFDSAAEVARQTARGDAAAVTGAKERAPKGARFTVAESENLVTVKVRTTVRPFAFGTDTGAAVRRASSLGAISLQAEATVVPEPGVLP
jgi:hypothetical protein